jgi:hypothetical protein
MTRAAPRRVAVLGGGRSSEHEVSLASSASVAEGLRSGGFEVVSVTIGRDGIWRGESGDELPLAAGRGFQGVDVVFPVLHGPFGEDGTVQGLLECLDVPYVGAGVAASAVCIDKVLFEGSDGAGRAAAGPVPRGCGRFVCRRSRGRARVDCAARVAGVRQAGAVGIVGRHRSRGFGRWLGRCAGGRVCARSAGDRRSGCERARGRVLGARQRRSDRLAAGRDPAGRRRERLVRLRGEVHAWRDAADRPGADL